MRNPVTILAFALFAISSSASVNVASPASGAKVTSPVLFAGTSTIGSCSKGVTTMGVAVDDKVAYVVNGTKLSIQLALKPGKHSVAIHEWDHCGKSTQTKRTITVISEPPPGHPGLVVTSPADGSLVLPEVSYVATATAPTCPAGVDSIGVYEGSELLTSQNGGSLNTEVNLGVGPRKTIVRANDKCGGTTSVTRNVTVQAAPNVLTNLQSSIGWESYGQLPPKYEDCSPCSGITWSLKSGISNPSLSGNAAEFDTAGTKPYAVVLWVNPVIGAYSTQGLPDKARTLVPSLHNFTYDTDFYVTNAPYTHALEFDVAMYTNGVGMFWGTQCAQGGDKNWDLLDKGGKDWVNSGVPCNYVDGWNHLTLQFHRQPDNSLLYKSLTLNGVVTNLNVTYAPQKVPSNWYGITVNYQMDGDKYQDTNTTYLDNLTLTYW
jgi:hypothetical protein